MKTILIIKDVAPYQAERILAMFVPVTCVADYAMVVDNIYVACESPAQAAHIIVHCEGDGFELNYRIDVTQG